MGKNENSKKEKGSENGDGRGRGPSSNGTVWAPIGDPRFSQLHTDPRFLKLPKNRSKVAIDSRFAHMFTEKGFNNLSADKRGIRLDKTNQIDPLRRYYKVDEEEYDGSQDGDGDNHVDKVTCKKKRRTKDRAKQMEQCTKSNEEIDESDDFEQELGASSKIYKAVARNKKDKKDRSKKLGIGAKEQISEQEYEYDDDESGLEEGRKDDDEVQDDDGEGEGSSSSFSSDSESDVAQEVSEAEDVEKILITNEETRRLAIVNMDWEHIRAVHLLVLMRSFAPKGGSVNSVSVYPSDFGIEQMKNENVHGPKIIFRQISDEDETDEEGADPEKLRRYEKAKLRYYYAVVECDSASTAGHLYKNCDGLEFERTSNTLDLRYIPGEMEFKRDPRDSATEVPGDYKPVEFETRALQHSNVKLTWDDDEPVRAKALRRNFKGEELNEMDFRAYVASSSESGSEAAAGEDANGVYADERVEPALVEDKKQKVRSKYVSLLTGTEEADLVHGKKAGKGNIEIKFRTGLDELSEKLLAQTKKDKADETLWEAYLRTKKEKKKARKNRKSATDSDLSRADEEMQGNDHPNHEDYPNLSHGDDDPFDDPFFNRDKEGDLLAETSSIRKGKEGKMEDLNASKKEEERTKKKDGDNAAREKKELKKKQAELELLLLDGHFMRNGEVVPDARSLDYYGKKQKPGTKKGSKGKIEELQEKVASTADYDDPRFASLFTSHLFALDPTDPLFKKTGSRVSEMQREHFQSCKNSQEQLDNSGNSDGEQGRKRKRKAGVSSLVRSLKSKVAAKAARK